MLPIQALQRHEKPVQAMAVWHDTVFTGSEDEEIKVMTLYYRYCVDFLLNRFLNISNYKKNHIIFLIKIVCCINCIFVRQRRILQ